MSAAQPSPCSAHAATREHPHGATTACSGEQKPVKGLEFSKIDPSDTSGEISAQLKWSAFAILVIQNSSAAVLLKSAILQTEEGELNTQCGVIVQEFVKGFLCIVSLCADGNLRSVFSSRKELLKTSIPSLLYLLQNNLQYIAASNLDAATFAVLYQTKLLITALLSVLLLGKKLSVVQWLALALLACGVACVSTSQTSQDTHSAEKHGRLMYGICTVFMATVVSGLAGVHSEKMLKDSSVSLWARNLQMATYSAMVGIGALMLADGDRVAQKGFFRGFTMAAWLSCGTNALGGLLVAVVVKYMDNIVKNYATSLALLLTAVLSVVVFGTQINIQFSLGTSLVIYSFMLYGGALRIFAGTGNMDAMKKEPVHIQLQEQLREWGNPQSG